MLQAAPVTTVSVITVPVPMGISVKSNVGTSASTSVVRNGAGMVVGMMRKSVSMNVTRIALESVKTMVTKEALLC